MTTKASSVLARVDESLPANNSFRALPVAGSGDYLIGRTPNGRPCLLVITRGNGRRTPLRLANVEAFFGLPCKVTSANGQSWTETLSYVSCLSGEEAVQGYFVSLLDFLIELLGASPTVSAMAEAVENLVDLFERLQRPAKNTVSGLVGELCVIDAAPNASCAVAAWHSDPHERFDFVLGDLRLEAKATEGERRIHLLSFEQANPPAGSVGLLASVFVRPAAGGTTLAAFTLEIENRLIVPSEVQRFRTGIADTLGCTLPVAMEWRFDLARARESLSFFELMAIPAVRGPLPREVAGVHFNTDVSGALPAQYPARLCEDAQDILPGLLPRR